MASSASSQNEMEKMHEIDLMSLTFPQLLQLKNELDQGLMLLQDSLETLKMTQTKFHTSEECLTKLTPDTKGAPVLIPLSPSMYVPGRIADADHCIVDIGTGYYVKKSIKDGQDYFQRKVEYVTKQMEKFQVVGQEKTRVREAIIEVMQIKAQQANMQANAAKA